MEERFRQSGFGEGEVFCSRSSGPTVARFAGRDGISCKLDVWTLSGRVWDGRLLLASDDQHRTARRNLMRAIHVSRDQDQKVRPDHEGCSVLSSCNCTMTLFF
jgi:hypothetical protein